MNIVKKTLCMVIALTLVCLSFAGCGNNSDTKASDLEKVKSAGKIIVGMECAYAPYNWSQTSENEYTVKVQDGLYADGYDIQIAKEVDLISRFMRQVSLSATAASASDSSSPSLSEGEPEWIMTGSPLGRNVTSNSTI